MRVGPTNLTVGMDADVVTRILAPVLDNARRYAGTEIRLDPHRVGPRAAIDISNDGPRIADELAERVFEPGFQTDPGENRGAGLGLALARRLAESADGSLTVLTGTDRTTFRLLLPMG